MFDVKLPLEKETTSPHLDLSLRSWTKLQHHNEKSPVLLDGESLDIPSVVAVAR
jgi:phenylalanine ammonia-lyase